MKANTKLIIAVVVLALGLIGCVFWAFTERTRVEEILKQYEYSLTHKDSSGANLPQKKQFTDTAGREHTVVENIHKNKQAVAVSKPLLDSITKDLDDVKPSAVEYWIRISATAEARALKAERRLDSANKLAYYYRDKYLSLSFTPPAEGDTLGSGLFDFKYNAILSATQYSKRNKIFGLAIGTKRTFTDVVSEDKRSTINGAKSFSVEQKQPAFGFRFQGVATYSFTNKAINFGPGIQLDLGRVSLLGAWYYNGDTQNFNKLPTVTARYDFFR